MASAAAAEGEATRQRNAYEVMGLDVTASKRAARQAFRTLAKDAHPDTGGSAVRGV